LNKSARVFQRGGLSCLWRYQINTITNCEAANCSVLVEDPIWLSEGMNDVGSSRGNLVVNLATRCEVALTSLNSLLLHVHG
jgi:hypothetical protein